MLPGAVHKLFGSATLEKTAYGCIPLALGIHKIYVAEGAIQYRYIDFTW
jgi:hypothetical protein